MKKKISKRTLARRIARAIFTSVRRGRAAFIRLYDADGKYLGAWSEDSVALEIKDFLEGKHK
jgi:hypothetical protein